MRKYRCRCGVTKIFSNESPLPCAKCWKCESGFSAGIENFKDPEPHKMNIKCVRCKDGEIHLSRCEWCGKTQAEIDKEESLPKKRRFFLSRHKKTRAKRI